MASLVRDVRHAMRRLGRARGFTAVALVTLALGIGANTALFSVVDAVLLEALPFKEPERLYQIWSRHTSTDRYPFQLPEFCDYRDQNRTMESFAGFASWSANLTGDGPAERLTGIRLSGNFFATLGVEAALGRAFREADDTPGQEKVVVLSAGLWQRRFGGDPAAVGKSLVLNGEAFTVVGVLPRRFFFPIRNAELAIPLAPDADPWRRNRDTTNFVRAVGRARRGVTPAQIAEDFDGIAARLKQEFPSSYARKRGTMAVPYLEEVVGPFRPALLVLQASVGLLLLIACANLANLQLVRATSQRREMAIRQALGASRGQLARQLLLESALLALGGAALGVLLAHWAVPALMALLPAALPRANMVRVSVPVLLFTLATAVVAGLGFGLVPARRASRVDPSQDLQADGRGEVGGADAGRARGLIVAAQVAIMVVLLTGAGLLLRSFREVMQVAPGFDSGVLTVRLSLPRKDYADAERMSRFYRQVEARLSVLPGVVTVGAVSQIPLNGALASADYKVAGRPPIADDQLPTAQYRMATPALFQAMGIPLLAGRSFSEEDREGRALVAVVNQALARQSFPDKNPVGEHLLVEDTSEGFRSLEIVGVVGDVRHVSLEGPPQPHLYVPYYQVHRELLVWLALNQFLTVRTAGAPLALAEDVRRAVQAVDPNVATADVRTSGDYVEAAASSRRFSLVLLGVFASLALVLAAVGIYGVVSYTVAQRTRETGVRIALGAGTADILGRVVGGALKRTALGLAVGLAAALVTSRALASQLYGVGALDPATYAIVVGLLVLVIVAACLVPAWRATRTDPVVALRGD
jgi:predicted permease